MTSVSNVLDYAMTKNAVELKPAIDDAMTDKLADYIEARRTEIAASMFGQEEVSYEEPSNEDNELSNTDHNEGTTDENL
jgi:hypothetical protein